jgi:fructosamine-3-kinase
MQMDLIQKLFYCFSPDSKIIRVSSCGGGLYNEVFHVLTTRTDYVLRIAPPDSIPKLFYEKDMIKSEPGIHAKILSQTDVPVAKIVYSDFSQGVIASDFLIMQFLPGHSGMFYHAELGRYVKQIHSVRGDQYGYPVRNLKSYANWPDTFKACSHLIFRDCLKAGAINQNEHDWFLSVFGKHHHTVQNVEPCLLHLDLWSANILTENGRITGILDWDRGLYGDPELEFAVLDTYGYSTPAFFKGYGSTRPCSDKAVIRQNLYIVYELIKYAFIRMARGRSYPTARHHVAQCKKILKGL